MLLVANAGYINAIAIIGYFQTSVGNVTGTMTLMGVKTAALNDISFLDFFIAFILFAGGL